MLIFPPRLNQQILPWQHSSASHSLQWKKSTCGQTGPLFDPSQTFTFCRSMHESVQFAWYTVCVVHKQPRTSLIDCRFYKNWSAFLQRPPVVITQTWMLYKMSYITVTRKPLIEQGKSKGAQCKSHGVSCDDDMLWQSMTCLYKLVNPLCVCVCLHVYACLAVNDIIPGDVSADFIKLECQHPEKNNTKLLIAVRNVWS